MVGNYINNLKTTFLFNKLFSNYKFISNQREAFLIGSFSWLLCFCVSMLLNKIKSQIESRLHCINITAYHCRISCKTLFINQNYVNFFCPIENKFVYIFLQYTILNFDDVNKCTVKLNVNKLVNFTSELQRENLI